MKLTKFSIWFMAAPAFLKGLVVNPLYQYLSYLAAYKDGPLLGAAVVVFENLGYLLSALVLFSALAGLTAAFRRRPKRQFWLPVGVYLVLLALNKVFAYLTTYGLTALGKSNLTLSMLHDMQGDLLSISLYDFAAGAASIVLLGLLVFGTTRFSERTQRTTIIVSYLVLQLPAVVYNKITLVMQAGAPTSFGDWTFLLGPAVRVCLFAVVGYYYLKGCAKRLAQETVDKQV
ncbi:MAG: hypothetical protein HFE78_00760 [Clostridiales bacterium]|nr:hypothetical protein [Clostridiales bacterium]